MVDHLFKNIISGSYFWLFGITCIYFLFLYFVLVPAFLLGCTVLHKRQLLNKIVEMEVSRSQVNFEIRHSLESIFIFGFSGIPIVYLIRKGVIVLLPDTLSNVIAGIVILVLWNEVHFFIVHRIMHLPFFMRKVHFVHHQSRVPTVYSVYSFHWFEALLLSTVPVTIAVFIPLSPWAIVTFPLISILLNCAGHCNYRFGKGKGPGWATLATNHSAHHVKGRRNYGFASNLLDQVYLLGWNNIKKKKQK